MLKYEQTEISKVERRQVRVHRTYEVLVKPLCLFDLEAYSLDGFELFFREVDYEAYAQVIQPLSRFIVSIQTGIISLRRW